MAIPQQDGELPPLFSVHILKICVQLFLLDTIDNLPRLRLSDSHMKLMLWVLKEAGCQDVPAFSALRRMQLTLRGQGGIRMKAYTSSLGNLFYMHDIGDIIAKASVSMIMFECLLIRVIGYCKPKGPEAHAILS